VALKKPSEFFHESNKHNNAPDKKGDQTPSANIETVSEAFNNFKTNANKINALSELNGTFEEFKSNIGKISILSEEVGSLQEEIKNFLTKKDLDNAIVFHLMTVDENIQNIQKNVKTLNSKSLLKIREEFSILNNAVSEFLEDEIPKYKRFLLDSEIRNDIKLENIESTLEEKINDIDLVVKNKFKQLEQNLEGINDNNLYQVKEDIKEISKAVKNVVNKELPKYNNFFVESELKTERKINELELKIVESVGEFDRSLDNKLQKISESLKEFVSGEIPKYNNFLVESKLKTEKEIKSIEEELSKKVKVICDNISTLEEGLKNKSDKVDEVILNLETVISSSLNEITSISKKYENLYKDFKGREISNSESLENFNSKLSSVQDSLESSLKDFDSYLVERDNLIDQAIKDANIELENKVKDLELSIAINESHIKKQNEFYENLKWDIHSTVKKLKIDYIEEQNKKLSSKINHIEEIFEKFNEKTILKEENSLLTDLPSSKTKDPLTPTNQNFVTFEDLANHYRTFINRVQVQMASIGGGGAGFIKDLDDVEFDSTTGDGKLLIYDQSRSKWVGIASTALGGGGSVGAGGTWQVDSVGIHTTKNVGIGTTANADYKLYVKGDAFFIGNISVAGTVTYDDVTNVDSLGIITAREDVKIGRNLSVVGITTLGSSNGIGTVTIGIGQTALYVDGDARIIGILTVGRSSVTIDGKNNRITAGIVTITNSTIILGDNITLSGNATGINSAPNVIYVAKDGNDSNNGTSIDNAKLTIAGAVGIAQSGTTIKVLSGTYIENNPITVPPFVSIVGDSLKTVTVIPSNATQDIFHLNKGTYLTHMTFTGHTYPSSAVAFPTGIATNAGGGDWESPYVQNCTSNTTTGTGMRIDGNFAEGLKSMVVDAYTQYNQGGVGIAITNNGYAQLVSVFTICCNEAITAYKGGQCSLTNSNTDFGTFGLVADGVSDIQFSGIVTSTASAAQDQVTVAITTSTKPYEGQVVYFGDLYYSVESITVTNGGSGYTSSPTVSISAPTGPNGTTATAFATLNGGSVESITIITSGNQYLTSPSVTISAPDAGVTAVAEATLSPIYYTINSSTPVTAGITTLTLDENLINSVGVGTTVNFYQVSKITATSHTFEYVGSGNTISSATPAGGGVANQENEIVERNGGKVTFTSTDQAGNFRIGNDIVIDQNNGTITGRAFTRSLFTQMTPFILALS